MTGLAFRILGPLELARGSVLIELGPAKQRALLALLVLNRGEVVSIDRLLDELWGDRPPASASHSLQVYVSNLRKLLGPDRDLIQTRRPGYVFTAAPEAVDVVRFESLVSEGRAALEAGDAAAASTLLRDALALWRGPAFADFAYERFAQLAAARLEELRVVTLELCLEADLALGRHADAAAEAEALVERHPLRERFWALLMLALYRSGRQADALGAYSQLRSRLSAELGIDPSLELRELERAILRQDPSLSAQSPPPPPAPTTPERGAAPVVGRRAGERRVVTVLVADLVSSTPLGERLDAEDYRLVVAGAVERMCESVDRFIGTVTHRPGDGIVAVFGWPFAHEDDPERAVRAGISVTECIEIYGDEVARAWNVPPLAVRVGVNTGSIVSSADDDIALGDAVNTAARIESAAPVNRVLVDADTRRLVERLFEWDDPAPLALKGKRDPVLASAVRSPRAPSPTMRGIEGVDVALIGRDEELARGSRALARAMDGAGGVLVVVGEPGVGKTRLLAELRRGLVGALWLEGRCLSYAQTRAHWPIGELLRAWLGASPSDPELRVRIALQRRAVELFGSGGSEIAFIASVMGLGLEPDEGDRMANLTPDALRILRAEAVRGVLERLAERGPVIAVFEDLHWADAASLDLLERLLPVTDFAAVQFVLTMRPEREHSSWRLREWTARELAHRCTEETLDPLSGCDDERLLRALVGDVLPADLEERVLTAAEGNPYFIEELVRSLIDARALVRTGDGWRFEHPVELEIPQTVEKALVSRIDRLSSPCRDVIGAASVLGREFGLDLLRQLTGAATPGAMQELQRLDLVREARRWPSQEYRFKHALAQEAAYNSLATERRRAMHRRTAEAIEKMESGRPADVARHWEEAGDLERAFTCHRAAASEAHQVYARDEALRHYSAAIALAERLGGAVPARTVNELRLGRGELRLLTSDERAGEDLLAACEGARAAGDRSVEWRALERLGILQLYALGDRQTGMGSYEQGLRAAREARDTGGELSLLARLAIEYATQLRFDESFTCASRALDIARASADDHLVSRPLDAMKLVAMYLGDTDLFERCARELGPALRRLGDLWYLVHLLAEHALVAAASGNWEQASALVTEGGELLRRSGTVSEESFIVTAHAWVERLRGRYGEAIRLARGAIETSRAIGQTRGAAWSEAVFGAILVEVGDAVAAVEVLEAGARGAENTGLDSQLPRAHACAATAYRMLGDEVSGRRHRDRAREVLGRVRTPDGTAWLYAADVYAAMARLDADDGDLERARAWLEPLLGPATRTRRYDAAAYAAIGLARCARVQGEDAEVARLAKLGLRSATQGGMPALQWQAHALLGGEESLTRGREHIAGLASTLDDDARERYTRHALRELQS